MSKIVARTRKSGPVVRDWCSVVLIEIPMGCRWAAEVIMGLHVHLADGMVTVRLELSVASLTSTIVASSTIKELSRLYSTLIIGRPRLGLICGWLDRLG